MANDHWTPEQVQDALKTMLTWQEGGYDPNHDDRDYTDPIYVGQSLDGGWGEFPAILLPVIDALKQAAAPSQGCSQQNGLIAIVLN